MKPFYVSCGAAASSNLEELRRGAADERSFTTAACRAFKYWQVCVSLVCVCTGDLRGVKTGVKVTPGVSSSSHSRQKVVS